MCNVFLGVFLIVIFTQRVLIMHKNKILIIKSNSYPNISKEILRITQDVLAGCNKVSTDVVTVPRISEIAHAMNLIIESNEYDGVMVLGCMIHSNTISDSVMLSECMKSINELAIHYSLPLGYCIISSNSEVQALQLVNACVLDATDACLKLMEIKADFHNNVNSSTLSLV